MDLSRVNSMISINWRKPTLPVKITTTVIISIMTAVTVVTGLSLYDQRNYFQQEVKKI